MIQTQKKSGVDACTIDDIAQVADLHVKVFYHQTKTASEQLRSYYRDVFFGNPWRDDELPSLVYRTPQGRVVGFMGRIPRRMAFDGQPIRVAIAHRLMVDPDARSPLAATSLVRTFLSGPQDLSLSDGANDSGRRFWEGAGGSTSLLHSMNWVWPLRPCAYVLNTIFGEDSLSMRVGRPLCATLDLLARRWWQQAIRETALTAVDLPLDRDIIGRHLQEAAQKRRVIPEYDPDSLGWLLEKLADNEHRGQLGCIGVQDDSGTVRGVCLFYLKGVTGMEVVLIAAPRRLLGEIYGALARSAHASGAAALWGRLDPSHLSVLFDNRCILKRGCWALVHARNAELVNAVCRGDVFLSALEGELWLRGPTNSL